MAELTDEALLSTQTAAVHVGTGKLNHFGEKGSQLPIYYLYGGWRKRAKMSEGAWNRQREYVAEGNKPEMGPEFCHSIYKATGRII